LPTHQFGFRKNHSTTDQVHRVTDIIQKTLENKGVCSAVFLDIAEAFDRVWHKGLLHKLRSTQREEGQQKSKRELEKQQGGRKASYWMLRRVVLV
jgi:retron-type reverse transcriptase